MAARSTWAPGDVFLLWFVAPPLGKKSNKTQAGVITDGYFIKTSSNYSALKECFVMSIMLRLLNTNRCDKCRYFGADCKLIDDTNWYSGSLTKPSGYVPPDKGTGSGESENSRLNHLDGIKISVIVRKCVFGSESRVKATTSIGGI